MRRGRLHLQARLSGPRSALLPLPAIGPRTDGQLERPEEDALACHSCKDGRGLKPAQGRRAPRPVSLQELRCPSLLCLTTFTTCTTELCAHYSTHSTILRTLHLHMTHTGWADGPPQILFDSVIWFLGTYQAPGRKNARRSLNETNEMNPGEGQERDMRRQAEGRGPAGMEQQRSLNWAGPECRRNKIAVQARMSRGALGGGARSRGS